MGKSNTLHGSGASFKINESQNIKSISVRAEKHLVMEAPILLYGLK